MNIKQSYQLAFYILCMVLLLSSCKNAGTSADPFRNNSDWRGTVIWHIDYIKPISLCIQVSDRKTGSPIKDVNVAVNSEDNVIGKTDDKGIYQGDTTVFWGLAKKPGQHVGINNSPEIKVILTHENYRDSAILEFKPNVTEIEKQVTLEVEKVNPDDKDAYILIYHADGGMSVEGGSMHRDQMYFFDDGNLKPRRNK